MRKALIVATLLLMTLPVQVCAQDWLSLYSDAAFTDCTLADSSPRIVNIYVTEHAFGATGIRFKVEPGPVFTGVWLGESSPFFTLGSSPTDISIGFTRCEVGHFLVLTMSYQLFGTSSCSTLALVSPFPDWSFPDRPLCASCLFTEVPCLATPLHINCPGQFACSPVATQASTWGNVKALYRN
jgi:hypothetical protein